MKRRPPTAEEKIAALLLQYWSDRGDPIHFEVAKEMTAHQVCSLVEWHHVTPYTWIPSNHPTVLVPVTILQHREITKKQAPVLAKVRRHDKKRKGRPMPGSKDSLFKKRMDGTVERRR